jgi:D-beta-D-heptose 7-phosphate kinase/D-beta-D-heptose 1-phosphate adenosyltransferase
MAKSRTRARDKVWTRQAACREAARAHRRGQRVVFTNGCFDLLHVGHVRSLEEARALGDRLIVGVNSDASVRRLKGRSRPVTPARQRAEVLAALACVDGVVVFGQDTPLSLIRALRPDVLAKGGDWAMDEIVGREDVEHWGGAVVRLREIPDLRTTSLLRKLAGRGTRRR